MDPISIELIKSSPLIAVLGWFMWQQNSSMAAMRSSIDRLTRAILIDIIDRPSATPRAKQQARELFREVGDGRE